MYATQQVNFQDITWDEDPCIFIFRDEIPGKHKMHVKNLDLHDWVRIDESYFGQMETKNKLYETNLTDIFVTKENCGTTDDCKWEFFQTLVDYLLQRYPKFFAKTLDGRHIRNMLTNCEVSIENNGGEDFLLRAGRLTQDDWIILEYDPNQMMYVLTAGVLCFPSNWDLSKKFNKPMTGIHEPVKPYIDHLKDKVNSLFDRMKPEKPMWRANWGIYGSLQGTTDLFLHPNRQLHAASDEADVSLRFEGDLTGRKLFLRCEYQTLRKLPKTKCIVFGIRTYQRYLEDLKQQPRDVSESLLTSIENLDSEYLSYKGGDVWKDAAVKYLHHVLREKDNEYVENQIFQNWFQ